MEFSMQTRTTSIRTRFAAMALAGIALTALSACSKTGIGALRADPTPELLTSVESPTESANAYAIQKNLNLRMILDDASRAIYIDRPSRLNPAPIPD
jgi:hypothetical protein